MYKLVLGRLDRIDMFFEGVPIDCGYLKILNLEITSLLKGVSGFTLTPAIV